MRRLGLWAAGLCAAVVAGAALSQVGGGGVVYIPTTLQGILALFSSGGGQQCGTGNFLRGDGTCNPASGSGPSSANPTATIGLTAVNGSATTFMTSNSAPALSQAIVPTWTGIHTFSAIPVFSAGETVNAPSGNLAIGITSSSAYTFGNATDNPTYTFQGTGVMTLSAGSLALTSGGIAANRISVNGPTIAVNGMYQPVTNSIGFSTNSTLRGQFDANGNLLLKGPIVASGTAVTPTGCGTPGSVVGGPTAGSFTVGTGATPCTFVFTFAQTQTHGYVCTGSDETAALPLVQSAHSTTSCSVKVNATTGDTIVWSVLQAF